MPAIGVAIAGMLASYGAQVALAGAVAAGTISATTVSFIAGAIGLIVSTGLSLLLNKAPAVARTDAQAADRKQAVRSGIAPRNIVYGRALVAGPVIFMSSSGTYNEWIHVVMPLAGHPVHGFDSVRINGFVIPVADRTAGPDGTAGAGVGGIAGKAAHVRVRIRAGAEQGTVPAGDIHSDGVDPEADLFRDAILRISLYDGTQSTADADLLGELPTEWDSAMILTGLPYVYIQIRYSNDVFGGGFQTLAVELRGKRLWDPRSDTHAYSDNAALAALDYLTSDYGLGIPSPELDIDAICAAANVCDEDVPLDMAATEVQPRYTTNGSYKLDQAPMDIMEGLLNGWGTLVYVQGLYRIHAAAAEASGLSLGAADFAGPIELVRNHPRRAQHNAITGTYVEPAQGWEAVAFPKVVSAAALAADGEEVSATMDLPFVIEGRRAQRLARLSLLTHRAAGFQVRAPLKYSAIRMACWDVVDLDLPEFGLDGDTFRVTSWRFDPVAGGVSVLLQSDVPDAYGWIASDGAEPILSEVSGLVQAAAVPAGETPTVAVSYRTQTDGTIVPRLAISWTATPPSPYITMIEVQWRDLDTGEAWHARLVPTTESVTYVEPIQPTHDYQVRLRYHTALVRGAWSANGTTTGEGNETATPAGPSGSSVTAILSGYRVDFTRSAAADLAATEIGEDVTPYEGTIAYVAETTGDKHVRMVASGDYAERRVYLRSRNTGGQRSSWALAGTVTPQTAGTADLAADAVTAIASHKETTLYTPTGTAWEDTDVAVTVTVATGEKVIIWAGVRLQEYVGGGLSGDAGEGGQNAG